MAPPRTNAKQIFDDDAHFFKQICESKNTSSEDDKCIQMCLVAAVMTKHQVRMALSQSNFTASFVAVLESMALTASTTPLA